MSSPVNPRSLMFTIEQPGTYYVELLPNGMVEIRLKGFELLPPMTPAAAWLVRGEADPHTGQYDGERAKLPMGQLTDDELANAVFMHGDERPSMADIVAGRGHMPIMYLTAAKERIRWLSRALIKALEARHDT